MQRFLLLTGLFCLLLFTACRKDVLHWQTVRRIESGTTHRLYRILFINDTLGFITGGERFSDADILTTHDGGLTFQYHTFPDAGKALYDITRAGNGKLYAIGFEGKLMSSTDGGADWHFRQLNYDPYKSIAVNKAGQLIVTGGISFEKGFTYHLRPNGDQLSYDTVGYELNQVRMLPDGTGYRCGYGTLARTIDDGASWQLQEPRRDNFVAMDVHSAQEVWTCGYNGSIYHTADGGQNWIRKRNGDDLTIPRYHLQDILFTDAQNGYAVGENGVVIYSDDGGVHWMEMDRFTDKTLHSIARCPDGSLLVCGDGGLIYRLQKK